MTIIETDDTPFSEPGPPTPPTPPIIEPIEVTPSPPPAPALQPAGFLRRAIAFSIDLFILGCLYLIMLLIGIFGVTAGSGGATPMSESYTLAFPFVSVWFFLFIGYFTFFHSYGGQTPAKRLIRIKVVSNHGGALTPFQAVVRSIAYSFSTLFFGFGFLIAVFEKKGRALHDLISRTQVVLS